MNKRAQSTAKCVPQPVPPSPHHDSPSQSRRDNLAAAPFREPPAPHAFSPAEPTAAPLGTKTVGRGRAVATTSLGRRAPVIRGQAGGTSAALSRHKSVPGRPVSVQGAWERRPLPVPAAARRSPAGFLSASSVPAHQAARWTVSQASQTEKRSGHRQKRGRAAGCDSLCTGVHMTRSRIARRISGLTMGTTAAADRRGIATDVCRPGEWYPAGSRVPTRLTRSGSLPWAAEWPTFGQGAAERKGGDELGA